MTANEHEGAEWIHPPQDMVQTVHNIIEGYRMGAMRAIAQDPPQNSLDAKTQKPVVNAYTLHSRSTSSGEQLTILTITDHNTTGLRGPSLTEQELRGRKEGYLLKPNENWAAWEAMGYTKVDEYALGSRGQGKAAFLYHSLHDYEARDRTQVERMIILYDSLLEDGTYRLGVRMARPADLIISPPYNGDEARRIISSEWTGDGIEIPLELEPLTKVGTRIIVPYLRQETIDAFRSREVHRWLERTWWRAIQMGESEITVGWEGEERSAIGVPTWWADEQWRSGPVRDDLLVQSDVPIERDSDLRIKRIVLSYDESLEPDEILEDMPEYAGIQLLRGHQWIETRGAKGEYGDFVPPERRDGFRGFVEFDRKLEKQLRGMESPQHDRFNRQFAAVKRIDQRVAEAVKEFAIAQGWYTPGAETAKEDAAAQELLERIAAVFVEEGGGSEPEGAGLDWKASLYLDYPAMETTRVELGDSLGNISSSVVHDPADERWNVAVSLSVISPSGERQLVANKARVTKDGKTSADFDDILIGRVPTKESSIYFQNDGKYILVAEWSDETGVVAKASRNVWVQKDPVRPTGRDVSASVSVRNLDADRIRINHGERIRVRVGVTNRTRDDVIVGVDVTLGALQMADAREDEFEIPGSPLGDVPIKMIDDFEVTVFTIDPDDEPDGHYVVLEPGRHTVAMDVYGVDPSTAMAHASTAVYVAVDPDEGGPRLPFKVQAWESHALRNPVWELVPAVEPTKQSTLWYNPFHPLYKAADEADTRRGGRRTGGSIYGKLAFWAETHCGALVEWALHLYREQGDEAGFALLGSRPDTDQRPEWESYESKVEELTQSYGDPLAAAALQREVVSAMLYLVEQELE